MKPATSFDVAIWSSIILMSVTTELERALWIILFIIFIAVRIITEMRHDK